MVRWEDTFIQLWGARTEAEDARRVYPLAERFLSSTAGPTLALVYIEADSAAPDAPARAELARLASLFRSRAAAIAYIYAGTGFKAAAIRSVMGAILLVGSLQSGTSTTPRTFAGPMPALAWMAARLPSKHPVRSDQRLATVESVLRGFRERAGAPRSATGRYPTLDGR